MAVEAPKYRGGEMIQKSGKRWVREKTGKDGQREANVS